MAMTAFAVPILPGKTEQWKKFTDDLNGKWKADFVASRKNAGVRERTFLQLTPMGDFVVVTIEGENPAEAMAKVFQAKDAFSDWFFQQVIEIHGMDLRQPPQGPPPQLVMDTGA